MPKRGRQLARFAPEGVSFDLAPELVPDDAYTSARDIHFRQGAERSRGLTSVFGTPAFPPRWLLFARDANEVPGWIYAGDTGLAFTDGSAHTNLTPVDFLAPTVDNPFTGGLLNNVPVVSARRPWYWAGDAATPTPFVTLPDWASTLFCNAMRPYKFHLMAMGINDAGTLLEDEVRFSDAADPGQIPSSWTPAPDNEAGSLELSQTGGACLDGAQLRSSFIVYKDTSTYVVDYVGGSVVMAQRLLFSQSGILAPNCVAELPGRHVVLTDGDVVIHDGQRVESIAENWVRRRLFGSIDGASSRNAFVAANYADSEVWVCIPEQGAKFPTVAFVWNIESGRWGVRDLPERAAHMAPGQVRLVEEATSWDADPEAWDSDPEPWDASANRVDFYELLEASVDQSQLFAVDLADTRDGAPVTAEVEKCGMTLGDPERVKTVKSVWLNVLGTRGSVLQVEVAGTFSTDESPSYGAPVQFVVGTDQKIDAFATGRFLHVRVSSDDAQIVAPWRLSSFTLEFEMRGRY